MKKALVLLLALSMVFGVFAAEPVANVNVSEFKGEASVTWGIDLDTEKTGFTNSTSAELKLNLLDGGDKSSTGEGIWGEIKIKTDGDTFLKFDESGMDYPILSSIDETEEDEDDEEKTIIKKSTWAQGNLFNLKMKVDTAKLHFGENAYVGIKSGDTQVGEYKLDTAIAAEVTKNGNVGDDAYKSGIVAGYGNDLFSVDVDFRSVDGYTNQYAFAVDGALKAVDNLTLKAGYAKDFARSTDESVNDAFYVASDYKLGLNDTFYLKPQIGYVHGMNSSDVLSAKVDAPVVGEVSITDWQSNYGTLVAAVLFGWGDKADSKPGVYFLDKDDDKKIIPGFSVAVEKQLVSKIAGSYKMLDKSVDAELKGTASPMTMKVSFFSGEIVENLTAAAYYETRVGATDYEVTVDGKDPLEGTNVETKTEVNPGFAFAAGLKYKLAVGEGSITPQFGIAMLGGYYGKPAQIDFVGDAYKGEILNLKLGAEFAGYVENTTFSVEYASKNLKADDNKGTLNFKCKIAL